ncbi:MAG: AAA family ATPase, partial [Acholeplasmataceae bacterium]
NELNVSSQLFAQAYYKIKDESKNIVSKNDNKPEHIENYEHLNLILYGPPGTGKTYNAKRYAVAICEGKSFSDICDEDYIEIVKRYDSYVEDGLIKFTTFHQSYSYEEFIEGIHPLIDDATNQISYKVKDGIFKEFCRDTSYEDRIKNQKVLKGNRVFIIDEINRGNISKIFGELITLIEESKRFGKEEALSATLPYTRESFSVPGNIYIIGTMNTADRSIALIDTALRRRFSFIEMMPDYSLLDDINIGEIEISNMLKTINDRIHVLYDREHAIGHSYFIEKELTIAKLGTIFKNKIIPLLQEYFYDDYEKIQMILGDNAKKDEAIKFIRRITNDNTFFRENIDANSVAEFRYEINDEAFSKEQSYLQIYRDLE